MKIDFKKTIPLYKAKQGRNDIVDVPPMRYLAMDAEGAPEDESFAQALSALFPMAYTLKFASKLQLGRDYVVPPLEALWWADDWAAFTTAYDKSKWHSTALSLLPEWITDEMVEAARAKCAAKVDPALLAQVRVETIHEGTCGQTLHIGSYDDEGPTIQSLHSAIEEAGLQLSGKHHEIYLSDFRKTAPEKLRTILRHGASRTS